MNQQFGPLLCTISIWALPAIISITFHEAAHGFAALRLGDDTAWRIGRVTFNPLKHIDPMGTILLPRFDGTRLRCPSSQQSYLGFRSGRQFHLRLASIWPAKLGLHWP